MKLYIDSVVMGIDDMTDKSDKDSDLIAIADGDTKELGKLNALKEKI